jgi:hypothetical protein
MEFAKIFMCESLNFFYYYFKKKIDNFDII